MHELMFQAGVKGKSERSELIPCTYYNATDINLVYSMASLWYICIYMYTLTILVQV